MTSTEHDDAIVFENEVRRIARCLWPDAEYCGSALEDGQERDGIFETDEIINCVEATTSREKKKAEKDIKKLVGLANKKSKSSKSVICWFVTKEEPTEHQREAAKAVKIKLNILSFSHFQSKLINAASYLSARKDYCFGSVRDPETNNFNPNIDYINLDLYDSINERLWNVNDIVSQILLGQHFLLLGEYGAGKSMTLREIFDHLRRGYLKGEIIKYPIYINLRDHSNQKDPIEVIERHARLIGFSNPSHLVRSWRAGYAILLLDGFDEIASPGIQGQWSQLRDARYRSVEVIRRLIRETPANAGLVIAGRPYFFDSDSEKDYALDINKNKVIFLKLGEFSEDQINTYMTKAKVNGKFPHWMPTRPLLVGYFIAKGIINNEGLLDLAPEEGWDLLISKVCDREAEIEPGINGLTQYCPGKIIA